MQANNNAWYLIETVDRIDSPALVVYRDRVKKNITQLINSINDPQRLRPHVKTSKASEPALLLLNAGIKKFKCATIAEAELLAQLQAPDVMLAYQPVGPKVQRLISLIKTYPATAFSCLTDNRTAAHDISQQAAQTGVCINVYIDLNVGMNRTGILPDESAVALYELCASLPGTKPVGLHVYDGHITDTDFNLRTEKCNAAFAPVAVLKKALLEKGFDQIGIVAGGSATFPIHAKRNDVQCSPGTFIYWDAGYARLLPEQPFEPAAVVITRIVSLPDSKTVCTDLGHKAIASESGFEKRIRFLNSPELHIIAHSEEHLVLQADENHNYKIGDVLYGVPYHICPTCALYERALVIEERKVTGEWKTVARNRKLSV